MLRGVLSECREENRLLRDRINESEARERDLHAQLQRDRQDLEEDGKRSDLVRLTEHCTAIEEHSAGVPQRS